MFETEKVKVKPWRKGMKYRYWKLVIGSFATTGDYAFRAGRKGVWRRQDIHDRHRPISQRHGSAIGKRWGGEFEVQVIDEWKGLAKVGKKRAAR